MHTKHLQLIVISLIFGCVVGMWTGNTSWAQAETPTETPIATPPVETATSTPVPAVDTPTPPAAPTDTPVVIPTESVTSTPVVTEPVRLSVEGGSVQVGDEIEVNVNIQNAVDLDAFSFVVSSSAGQLEAGSLSFVSVETAGTLTQDFFSVSGVEVDGVVGAMQIRIAGIGGNAVASGDGILLKVKYLAVAAGDVSIELIELVDDVANAEVTSGVVAVTGGGEPTETPTEVPIATDTPIVVPTETQTEVPVPTDTPIVVVPTETMTEIPEATSTPVPVATNTPNGTTVPIPVYTPTSPPTATPVPATPTMFIINPDLGLVSYDLLGGSFARGAAIHNFDIGLSVLNPYDPYYGRLFATQVYDGLADLDAFGPYLVFEISDEAQGYTLNFMPIAKDMEFTGEILPGGADGGTGTEGLFYLIGGNIGPLPPVNSRLGAGIARPDPDTGNGAFGGGIDVDNDPSNNIDFGSYRGDIVPVGYNPAGGSDPEAFDSMLVDIEPAGNTGFYVLSRDGRIYAEGSANEALDTQLTLPEGVTAVNLEIYRGTVANGVYSWAVDMSNSKYGSNLAGVAAYVLDSAGAIHRFPADAPEPNMENVPSEADNTYGYKDIEFIPSSTGDSMIGLGVLAGDGRAYFAPFVGEDTEANKDFADSIMPFANLPVGFGFDIARDFEVEIKGSSNPFYGVASDGSEVVLSDVRVGTYMTDGYGGLHIGGAATRFAAAPVANGLWSVNGVKSVPVEVIMPYYIGSDFVTDLEIAWPLNPAHVNPAPVTP